MGARGLSCYGLFLFFEGGTGNCLVALFPCQQMCFCNPRPNLFTLFVSVPLVMSRRGGWEQQRNRIEKIEIELVFLMFCRRGMGERIPFFFLCCMNIDTSLTLSIFAVFSFESTLALPVSFNDPHPFHLPFPLPTITIRKIMKHPKASSVKYFYLDAPSPPSPKAKM